MCTMSEYAAMVFALPGVSSGISFVANETLQ
jgi:hypothetical protein